MVESSESVSVDAETIYLGRKEHTIRTGSGSVSVSVIVNGDQDKPALVTYPDLALNYLSCFQGLFFCPEAASLLLRNFCIYHISPPGHELLPLGAAAISRDYPLPSVDDLTDKILEAGCSNVHGGNCRCSRFLQYVFMVKYRARVVGLILTSPLCKAASWTEWLCDKVLSNLLYFYGMCGLLKECLLYRYFSKEVRGGGVVLKSDVVQACRKLLEERQSVNVF